MVVSNRADPVFGNSDDDNEVLCSLNQMVIFDSQFRTLYADAVKKARTEKIRVVKLEDNLYYVARRVAGHGRYLVYIDVAGTGTVTATCKTIGGLACPAYGCCVHLAAVFERLAAEVSKIQRKEVAA